MHGADGFFTSRWRGDVSIGVLFWRDLLLVATLISALATGVALAMAASKIHLGWAAAVHFAPLPYNLFLVAAVWRLPGRPLHRWASVVWLAIVTLV